MLYLVNSLINHADLIPYLRKVWRKNNSLQIVLFKKYKTTHSEFQLAVVVRTCWPELLRPAFIRPVPDCVWPGSENPAGLGVEWDPGNHHVHPASHTHQWSSVSLQLSPATHMSRPIFSGCSIFQQSLPRYYNTLPYKHAQELHLKRKKGQYTFIQTHRMYKTKSEP